MIPRIQFMLIRRSLPALVLAFIFINACRVCAFDVEGLKSSVPRIVMKQTNGYESGSGFVIHSGDDYCIVVTNYHVVEEFADNAKTPVYVLRKVPTGIEKHLSEIMLVDKDRDIALLKVPGMKAQPLTLLTAEPQQADDAYSIGYPGIADDKDNKKAIYNLIGKGPDGVVTSPDEQAVTSLEVSVSKGTVRRLVTSHWVHLPTNLPIRIIQNDVNIGHGNSGGPLFNASGQVIGINTASRSMGRTMDVDKFSLASHSSALIDVLKAQNITFLSADTAGVTQTASETGLATATGVTRGGGGISTYLMIFVGGLAVFAVFMAMRRQTVVETYSHFVRRKRPGAGPAPGHGSSDDDDGNSVPTTPPEKMHFERGTVSSSGAFVLEGKDPDDRTQIHLAADDEVWRKAGERILVGRSAKQSHLCLKNKSVSGAHLSVLRHDARFLVEDRDSSNGTSINGKKLVPFAPMPIEDGDWLQVGDVLLRFRLKQEGSGV